MFKQNLDIMRGGIFLCAEFNYLINENAIENSNILLQITKILNIKMLATSANIESEKLIFILD